MSSPVLELHTVPVHRLSCIPSGESSSIDFQVLSSPEKRQIYDIYGTEGLQAGLELGPHLGGAQDIKNEWTRFKKQQVRALPEATISSAMLGRVVGRAVGELNNLNLVRWLEVSCAALCNLLLLKAKAPVWVPVLLPERS